MVGSLKTKSSSLKPSSYWTFWTAWGTLKLTSCLDFEGYWASINFSISFSSSLLRPFPVWTVVGFFVVIVVVVVFVPFCSPLNKAAVSMLEIGSAYGSIDSWNMSLICWLFDEIWLKSKFWGLSFVWVLALPACSFIW